MAAIGKQPADRWRRSLRAHGHVRCPNAVLHTRRTHVQHDREAFHVYKNVALTPFDPLARVMSTWPALSVVFTVWLSITPAAGTGGRPAQQHAKSRNTAIIRS